MNFPASGFDFHCHVDLFPDPVAAIASRERGRVVTLAVTTTPMAWAQNRRWMADCRYVHPALGLHPELAGERPGEIDLLEQLLSEATFVGEIGLDGGIEARKHWHVQREVFVRALVRAHRLGGRVASIHSRRAAGEVLTCLAEHTTPQRVLPILHWFGGTRGLTRQAVRQGCYFSINNRMLESERGLALVRDLPLDRILTETDAPFACTNEVGGEPQDIRNMVNQLGEFLDVSAARMTEILSENAARVFAFAGETLTGLEI